MTQIEQITTENNLCESCLTSVISVHNQKIKIKKNNQHTDDIYTIIIETSKKYISNLLSFLPLKFF